MKVCPCRMRNNLIKTINVVRPTGDLESAEKKHEEVKKELENTLAELNDI